MAKKSDSEKKWFVLWPGLEAGIWEAEGQSTEAEAIKSAEELIVEDDSASPVYYVAKAVRKVSLAAKTETI